MSSRIEIFAKDLGEWADATFSGDGPARCIAHLAAEVLELADSPYDAEEYADCFMLIIDAARRAGIDINALIKASEDKLEICKTRKWGALNEQGFHQHIE